MKNKTIRLIDIMQIAAKMELGIKDLTFPGPTGQDWRHILISKNGRCVGVMVDPNESDFNEILLIFVPGVCEKLESYQFSSVREIEEFFE